MLQACPACYNHGWPIAKRWFWSSTSSARRTQMPEKQNIEWKSKWKDAYLEWVCGFANAQGGKMDIGRNDDGEIIGAAVQNRN